MTRRALQPDFGDNLMAIRLSADHGKRMNRTDFATQLGLTPGKLRSIELNIREPFEDEIVAVLTYYDLSEYVTTEERPASHEEPPVTPSRPAEHVHEVPVPVEVTTSEDDSEPRLEPEPEPELALDPELPGPELAPSTAILFSNSEIQTFKRCRRKWWLQWYRNLRLRREDKTGARSIGSRVHRALEAYYTPDPTQREDPSTALERVIVEDWTIIYNTARQDGYDYPDDEVVRKFRDVTDTERAIVEGYMEWLAETGIDQGLTVTATETYLEARLDEFTEDVRIIGKLDARAVRETDGANLFIDHKTVGSLNKPAQTLQLDEQMLHYTLLQWLNAIESGDPRCDGALYNMLRKVKRTAKANPPFYGRVEVRHNTTELNSFRKRLVGVIRDIMSTKQHLDQGHDPLTVVYPTPKGDCSWDCDFLQVCSMFDDGSRVEDALTNLYETVNPLDHYKDERPNEEG